MVVSDHTTFYIQ